MASARAGWSRLLPEHRAVGDDQPVGQPTCVAALPLADGLVLAVVEDERGRTYPVPLVVDGTEVRRARPGDGAAEALVSILTTTPADAPAEAPVEAPVTAQSHRGFEMTTWHTEPVTGERGITVDQTNESVIVGERAVVKWTFVAGEGPHPAPSILAELERNGFTGMPEPWAAVQWRPWTDSAPRLLALVTGFVPGAVDGWTWLVEDLRDAAASVDEQVARRAGTAVGELVASFHRALARTARAATGEESATWREGMLAELDRALAVATGGVHEVLSAHAAEARAVLASIPSGPTPVMRLHGDLHVGQVLRFSQGTGAQSSDFQGSASQDTDSPTYLLTDFDGNPVLSPAERLADQPAAQDVAGMAQSFTHAGLVVRKHYPGLDGHTVDRMAEAAREAFLDAYRSALGDHADLLDERLLRPFALRQVCREFIYAATHLPRWSYIPEAALPMLLRREPSQENA